MKKIILILLFIPLLSKSQDSARVEVSNVVLKGKDVSFLYYYLEKNTKNESLDSSIKVKFRPTAPGDNTDVTFNNIERRVWRDIIERLSGNIVAIHPANDYYKRIRNAVQLINDGWLIDKISRIEAPTQAEGQQIQDYGKKAARRIED